jgi:cytoskeletal protein CcmA (bactofilin family)
MFKGDKDKNNFDQPEKLNRLVVGTKLFGDLTTESSLRVDGSIQGNVNCSGKIVIGKEGNIVGDVISVQAEIEGSVEGDLKVEDILILQKTAIIKGAMSVGRLVIEDGAQIGGNVETGDISMVGTQNSKTDKAKSNPTKADAKDQDSDVVY